MTAQPIEPMANKLTTDPYEVIQQGKDTAVVVPIDEFLHLRALQLRASEDEWEEALAEALKVRYDEWVKAGRPGEMSHEEVKKLILGDAE